MNNELLQGLNRQLNMEFHAAYLYLSMSKYFSEITMDGFAKALKNHAEEELHHADKIYNYLIERDEKVELHPIEAPNSSFENPLSVIKGALEHEIKVTSSIEALYEEAKDKKDWATEVFLQWFITEQVEEEDKFRNLMKKLENIQNYDCEVNRIDRHLED